MPLLSVIILTFNEEGNLPGCLSSLEGLDCDVFVVDSGSQDRTLEIARAAGCHIARHEFEHYGAQRNWALQNLPITTEWILNLDADERLTGELCDEINREIPRAPSHLDGFLLRQRTVFMGRWIRHGGHYPSYHQRLFRRGKGRCEDRLYDQHFLVDGPVKRLRHDYIDVVASGINEWTTRHLRWAEMEASDILERSRASTHRVQADPVGNPIERRRWLREGPYGKAPLFLRAFLYWFYRYFLRLGVLDGKEGLIFHFLQGCWFRFMVDVKLHEKTAKFGCAE